MLALQSTIAPMPTREHVFLLTDSKDRTSKGADEGGIRGSKMLGTYGREMLSANGELLLHFAEDNKFLVYTRTFAPLKVACPTLSKKPNAAGAMRASIKSGRNR